MRKKNFKGRCEKITVTKSKSICKTYDDLQRSYLEKLEANSDIQEIRMNIVLDSLPDYTLNIIRCKFCLFCSFKEIIFNEVFAGTSIKERIDFI